MPTYGMACVCGQERDIVCAVADRDSPVACDCGRLMARQLSSPLFKFKGQVTPGGGPDRFTADMLDIPLKELPAGLRQDKGVDK